MKKVTLVLMILISSTAQANYLSLESENLGENWQPRLGFFMEPATGFLVQFRHNMIGAGSGVLGGYNFIFGSLTINPNLGINISDRLSFSAVRPELQLFFKFCNFSLFALASVGLPISEKEEFTMFALTQLMYNLNEYYLGVKAELQMDLSNFDMFIQAGPRIGYLYHKFYFGLWGGIQAFDWQAFLRVEAKFIF